jgi:hypothetical protein
MKRHILTINDISKLGAGFLLGISSIFLFGFNAINFTPSASTAEVNKIDGFYLFTDSQPVMTYDSLGIVEIGFITDTQYESIRGNLIKKARNKYPEANGLIIQLDKKGVDKCKVIKFK